jgi:hypothetical protein
MKTKLLFLSLCLSLVTIFTSRAMADKQVYLPVDLLSGGDPNDTASTWCYQRSIQGDDIIIFWGKGYGTNDPNSTAVPEAYRVDVRDMLAKLESFYDLNVNKLKFAVTGKDSSMLDKYKMVIMLYYTTDWMAYGAGFDDKIGGMWVSPSTCHPVGSTIAHEIGHSFQYQVYCDYLLNHPNYDPATKTVGFRYASGGSFWETTAQWQSVQAYPDEFFTQWEYPVEFQPRSYCHPFNEDIRYGVYFFPEWFAYKHGIEAVSQVWRNCQSPEDASETYMHLFYGDSKTHLQEYNDELYDMASRWVTWDIPSLRERGKNHIGDYISKLHRVGTDSLGMIVWQVDSANCLQEHGFNHVELNVPEGGGNITAYFKGVAGIDGYNKVDNLNSGWRYGFVALLDNGERVYSDVHRATHKAPTDTATFNVPANTSRLWLVVLGAPSRYYRQHAWDNIPGNDEQWPYQISFENTNLLGFVTFAPDEVVHNATVTYDINVPISADNSYECLTFKPDMTPAYHAFLLEPDEFSANLGKYSSTKSVRFCNLNANESIYNGYTTNTTDVNWGGWYDINGNVCSWGNTAYAYCDFNTSNKTFTIGRFPDKAAVGDKMIIRQAFIYKRKTRVTYQLNLTFVDKDKTAEITNENVVTTPTGIQTATTRPVQSGVYDLQGRLVDKTSTAKLPKGLYISNGHIVVK